ncbi:MAG: hypothetical protein ACK4L7_07775 [Flavobacteriales bacterium]
MRQRDLLSAAVLAMGLALGALREFLFTNLNYQLDFLRRGQRGSNYAHSAFQRWAESIDLQSLLVLKWAAAAGFVAAMLGLTLVLARLRMGSHRLARVIIAVFAGAALLALACHWAAPVFPGLGPVSIDLLHALQYPLPLLVVWAGSWLAAGGGTQRR